MSLAARTRGLAYLALSHSKDRVPAIIEYPMKLCGMHLCIAVALLAPLVVAQSAGQDELPSAPSATVEQNQAKQNDRKKAAAAQATRSEERRVGKEYRYQRWRVHEKKIRD